MWLDGRRRAGRRERDTNPSDFERAGEGRHLHIFADSVLPGQVDQKPRLRTVTPHEQDQSEKRAQIRHKSAEAGERESERG